MSDDDEPRDIGDTTYRHVKTRHVVRRRTPSAPMAAMNPLATEDPYTTMGPRTRDEVLLKMIARVERIDTEMGDLVAGVSHASTEARLARTYYENLAQTVGNLEGKIDTIKGLLVDLLTRLPPSEPAPESG